MINKLSIGFSPCPNDCFIFDALIHHKIDTEGLTFKVVMDDVETLNEKAFEEELDITKLSFHAFAYLTKKYQLLNAGSALGKGCGPLVICKNNASWIQAQLQTIGCEAIVAIPGKYTTANFLFSLAFPHATNKIEMGFSDIEEEVLRGKVDAGLIIHENRFTYEQKGLQKVIDLGEFWESTAIAPIPLGGIVIKRNLPNDLKHKMDRLLRKSVEYAFQNPLSSLSFVKDHSQAMDDDVIGKHIDLYVNDFSLDLGKEGKRAVTLLFDRAAKEGIINKLGEEIFL